MQRIANTPGVGPRIAAVRGRMSRRAFAERLKMPALATTLVRYETGEREPPADVIATIVRTLGVDAGWLLTGEGVAPAAITEEVAIEDDAPTAVRDTSDILIPTDDVVRVPLLAARLGAGPGDQADDARAGTYPLHADDAAALGHPRVHLRAARVRGDSMAPLLHDGDTVVVVRDAEARDGVCVIVLGGEVMVKRVQWARGGGMRIVSENPAYAPIEVGPDDDVRVIGRVVMRTQRGMR